MRRFVQCVLVFGALAVTQTAAWAQTHPQTRSGFWLSTGLGYGSANASFEGDEGGGRDGALTAHLRLGGKIGERTLLGCETNVWTRPETEATVTLGNVSAALYFYPVPGSGFFVKAGAGFGTADFTFKTLDQTASGMGPGFIAGAGYDYRIGKNVSLTPMATYYLGWPGELKLGNGEGATVTTGFKHNVLEVGLGITFH
jgi:hypothetical protein